MKVENNTNEKILAFHCIRTLATTSKSSNNKPQPQVWHVRATIKSHIFHLLHHFPQFNFSHTYKSL